MHEKRRLRIISGLEFQRLILYYSSTMIVSPCIKGGKKHVTAMAIRCSNPTGSRCRRHCHEEGGRKTKVAGKAAIQVPFVHRLCQPAIAVACVSHGCWLSTCRTVHYSHRKAKRSRGRTSTGSREGSPGATFSP